MCRVVRDLSTSYQADVLLGVGAVSTSYKARHPASQERPNSQAPAAPGHPQAMLGAAGGLSTPEGSQKPKGLEAGPTGGPRPSTSHKAAVLGAAGGLTTPEGSQRPKGLRTGPTGRPRLYLLVHGGPREHHAPQQSLHIVGGSLGGGLHQRLHHAEVPPQRLSLRTWTCQHRLQPHESHPSACWAAVGTSTGMVGAASSGRSCCLLAAAWPAPALLSSHGRLDGGGRSSSLGQTRWSPCSGWPCWPAQHLAHTTSACCREACACSGRAGLGVAWLARFTVLCGRICCSCQVNGMQASVLPCLA